MAIFLSLSYQMTVTQSKPRLLDSHEIIFVYLHTNIVSTHHSEHLKANLFKSCYYTTVVGNLTDFFYYNLFSMISDRFNDLWSPS